jgi:hypothetical protein
MFKTILSMAIVCAFGSADFGSAVAMPLASNVPAAAASHSSDIQLARGGRGGGGFRGGGGGFRGGGAFRGGGFAGRGGVAVALHTGATQGAALLRIAVMGTAVEACATAADTVTVDGMPEGTDATGTDDTAGALLLSARRRPARTTTIMAAIMTATGVGSARANIRIELSKFQAKADKTAFAGNDRDFSATL